MSDLRNKAIALLARREHSMHELKQKLANSGDLEEIAILLADLRAQDLQSDSRFTASFIRSRKTRGYGPIRIRQELFQRGIAATLIEEHLSDGDPQWQVLLLETWRKKYRGVTPQDQKTLGQHTRFLLQRGYDSTMVARLLKTGMIDHD